MGGVVGGVAFIALVGAAIWYFRRRKRRQAQAALIAAHTGISQKPQGLPFEAQGNQVHEMPHHYPYSQGGAELPAQETPQELQGDYSHPQR